MEITRYNYEEFFLLYVDNELKEQERAAVENFVNENSDLAKELKMLLHTKLPNAVTEFAKKDFLYKKANGVSLANYEEYFLLFTDKELNEKQIAEVEDFVLQHPQLRDEFTMLQKTKLEPELIVFKNKKKLYQSEKKLRKIALVMWIRMSAAAAFAGLIVTAIVLNNTANNNNYSTVFSYSPKAVKTTVKASDKLLTQKSAADKFSIQINPEKKRKNSLKNTSTYSEKLVKVTLDKRKSIKSEEKLVFVKKIKKQLLTEAIAKVEKPTIAETTVEELQLQTDNYTEIEDISSRISPEKITDNSKPIHSLAKQSVTDNQLTLVSHAVYLATENDEEDKTLYIGSAQINKNKLKGLFKKAAGFFDKKIRRNDER